MPVLVEQWYVLILVSLYTLLLLLLQATRSQSIWRGLDTNKYIPLFLCLQLIHILALSPQVMVYSTWIFAEHIQLWNRGHSLSYGVRVE